jgi:hypothetical protein
MTVHYKLFLRPDAVDQTPRPFAIGAAEFAPVVGDIFQIEGFEYLVEKRYLPHDTTATQDRLNIWFVKLIVAKIEPQSALASIYNEDDE